MSIRLFARTRSGTDLELPFDAQKRDYYLEKCRIYIDEVYKTASASDRESGIARLSALADCIKFNPHLTAEHSALMDLSKARDGFIKLENSIPSQFGVNPNLSGPENWLAQRLWASALQKDDTLSAFITEVFNAEILFCSVPDENPIRQAYAALHRGVDGMKKVKGWLAGRGW